jgi:hypothetical protein
MFSLKPIKKFSFRYKKYLIIVLIVALIGGFVWFNVQERKVALEVTVSSTASSQQMFYPTLYSSTHITQNAIIADPRFKNVTLIDKESLLSNVISSVKQNTSIHKLGELESGTWLWTPLLDITPSYRTEIISGAKKINVNTIYLSIDSYLDIYTMQDGSEKDTKRANFSLALENFIKEAHKNNIEVVAEAGWQNWAEKGNSYKPLAVMNYVIQYNQNHKDKLWGFQYDVEPYILPSYKNNKKTVLYNFVNLIDQSVTKLNGSDLELSVVIPDFYDSASGETPQYSFRGVVKYTFDHLLSVLERRKGSEIIVMSYRNVSKGDDGSIDISTGEITKADNYHSRIVIAQETGDILPPYVTFHNTSRSYYNKQVASIQNAFASNKSIGGIAEHYVNAFLELK